jgi:hypothetical protein
MDRGSTPTVVSDSAAKRAAEKVSKTPTMDFIK